MDSIFASLPNLIRQHQQFDFQFHTPFYIQNKVHLSGTDNHLNETLIPNTHGIQELPTESLDVQCLSYVVQWPQRKYLVGKESSTAVLCILHMDRPEEPNSGKKIQPKFIDLTVKHCKHWDDSGKYLWLTTLNSKLPNFISTLYSNSPCFRLPPF